MWKNINFERCFSYINSQVAAESGSRMAVRPCITISRQCGAGGRTVASRLSEYLQTRIPVPGKWPVFDKNLIEKVLEDHQLSKSLVRFVPEAHKSLLEDMLEELMGVHPPTAVLVRQTVETIWDLAEKGNVIIVGRGGNMITAKLEKAFHVRLVGSVPRRVQRLIEVYDFDFASAREFLKVQDANKRRYVRDHFGGNIDDPLLYHMVINTDGISYEDAAILIGNAVIDRLKLVSETKAMAV